jgi:hypothetical protein
MKSRKLRPVWADNNYLIGNMKNGWICNTVILEEWEKEYPCNLLCGCSSGPCSVYNNWLSKDPFRRVGG